MLTAPTLVVIRTSPFGSSRAAEGLDAILAFAIFDQPLAVLFMDDGVFGLPAATGHSADKSFSKMAAALPLYDVEHIYIHQASLTERGLSSQPLVTGEAKLIDDHELGVLLRSAKHTLSF